MRSRLESRAASSVLPSQPCLAGWASAGLRRTVRAPAGDAAPHRPHPRLCHPSGTVALCFHYFARDFDPVPPGTDARSDSQALRGSSPLDRARGQKESNANSPRCATPPRPALTLRNARRPPAGGAYPGYFPKKSLTPPSPPSSLPFPRLILTSTRSRSSTAVCKLQHSAAALPSLTA